MRSKPCLTTADVKILTDACREAIEAGSRTMTFAIVDDGGHLLHLSRDDGARISTIDVATGKARTAAFSRSPTRLMEARLKENPALFFLNAMPMQGGLPILHEGQCVGGIGVSGGTPQQDEDAAEVALAALCAAQG